MLTALFDISWIYDVIIVIAIIAFVVICFRFKNGKYVILSVLAVALVGSGVYSYTYVDTYYSARGGIRGTLLGSEIDLNKVTVTDSTFEFKNVEMKATGVQDEYLASCISKDVFKLDNDKNYLLTVNNEPCQYVQNAHDYVIATYKYNFYDSTLNVSTTDTLKFVISFYKNSTLINVSTNGGASAVRKWNYYFNVNEFKLRIEQVDNVYFSNNVAGVNNLKAINITADNTVRSKVFVLSGSDYTIKNNNKDSVSVAFLKQNNQLITSLTNVTEDITIEGIFARDTYKMSDTEYLITGYNGKAGVYKFNTLTMSAECIYKSGNWGEITKVAVGIVEPSLDPTTGEMSGETSTIWGYRFKGVGNYNILTWNPQSGDFSLVDGTPGSGSQIPGGEKDPPNSEWGDL